MNCLAQTHDVADLHGRLFMRHCHHLVSAANIKAQQTNADDNPKVLIIIKITRLQLNRGDSHETFQPRLQALYTSGHRRNLHADSLVLM